MAVSNFLISYVYRGQFRDCNDCWSDCPMVADWVPMMATILTQVSLRWWLGRQIQATRKCSASGTYSCGIAILLVLLPFLISLNHLSLPWSTPEPLKDHWCTGRAWRCGYLLSAFESHFRFDFNGKYSIYSDLSAVIIDVSPFYRLLVNTFIDYEMAVSYES